jgi:hypothetical protein
MSSSFRNLCRAAPILALAAAADAWAQETVITPAVDVGAEWDSNREMLPETANADSSMSYRATLETTLSRRTPRSQTTFRPRIVAQEFPDRSGIDPIEGFLDLRTNYQTLKGNLGLLGRWARQDAIHAEFSDAAFDDFDPNDPQAGEQSIVLVGRTRTTTQVMPTFAYSITETTQLDANVEYLAVDYSDDVSGVSQSYTSPSAEVTIAHEVTPRAQIAIGPYYARFETDDDINKTDTIGAVASWRYRWSEITFAMISLRFERNDVEDQRLLEPQEESTDWGIEFSGARTMRVGSMRYSLGRFLSPSTIGSRRQSDQFRFQYDRPLSPRIEFGFATRLARDTRVGSDPFATGTTTGDGRRERARAELNLRWMMSRTMYIGTGYRFAWQNFDGPNDGAKNHAVLLTFGYRAFTPQR